MEIKAVIEMDGVIYERVKIEYSNDCSRCEMGVKKCPARMYVMCSFLNKNNGYKATWRKVNGR